MDDYKRGHLDLLSGLTQAPDTGEPGYTERFKLMKSFPGTYYIIVFTPKDNPDKVVASGTLLVERKFIRNLASSGHIEDIVVDKAIQGKGLGKKLLQSLIILSRAVGNYKTLLDCSDENRGKAQQVSMRWHGWQAHSLPAQLTPCTCFLQDSTRNAGVCLSLTLALLRSD